MTADSVAKKQAPFVRLGVLAAALGISRQAAAAWCRAGRVRGAIKLDRLWLVPLDEFEYISNRGLRKQ